MILLKKTIACVILLLCSNVFLVRGDGGGSVRHSTTVDCSYLYAYASQ